MPEPKSQRVQRQADNQDFRNTRRALDFQGFPPCKRLLQKFSRFGTLPA
jgi:hypothetical protein